VTYKKAKQKLNIRLLKPNYTGPILSPYMQKDLFYQERFFTKPNQLNNQMTTKREGKRNKIGTHHQTRLTRTASGKDEGKQNEKKKRHIDSLFL